jgi:DNA-binding MarR family transcriptional regulator
MSAAESQNCSNFKLRQLMRRVSQHYDAELGKIHLKTTQYSLLSHVARLGPIRPSDLADAMTIDASTLTRNLKPLAVAGWITVAAGADSRSHLVAITDAGRAKRKEGQRHWKAAQEGFNALLGAERVRALHALIDGSLDRFSEVDGRDTGGGNITQKGNETGA